MITQQDLKLLIKIRDCIKRDIPHESPEYLEGVVQGLDIAIDTVSGVFTFKKDELNKKLKELKL